MDTTARRVRLVVDFAGVTQLSAAKWRKSLGGFLITAPNGQPGSDTGGVWYGSQVPNPIANELTDLQLHVRRLVDAVVNRTPLKGTEFLALGQPTSVPSVGADGAVTLTVVDGTFSERVFDAVKRLLAHTGAGAIRACPICARVFVKEGKRQHCGRSKCEVEFARAGWRRWSRSPNGQRYLKDLYKKNDWKLGARSQQGESR
jgi:hypothetical protein